MADNRTARELASLHVQELFERSALLRERSQAIVSQMAVLQAQVVRQRDEQMLREGTRLLPPAEV